MQALVDRDGLGCVQLLRYILEMQSKLAVAIFDIML